MAVVAAMALLLPACLFSSPAHQGLGGPNQLRIGIRELSTLDPDLRANPSDLLVADQIFQPMIGFNPKTDQLEPRLASSWQTLDGGSQFVFHLRPSAKFQNGQPVTASDVAFALNRLAQKSTDSSLAYLLSPVAGFDAVNVTGTATTLSGVSVLDDHTLQISLTSPWVDFPYVLTDPATAPIPATAFQANPTTFMQHPIGAGPYELATPSGMPDELVLKRFSGYWGAKPAIPSVRFVFNPDPDSVLGDITKGKLDVGEVPSGSMSSALKKLGSRGFTQLAAGLYLGFNLNDPNVGSLPLRQAISLAINRQAIASQVYGNVVVPADSIVPGGLPGHSELACGGDCDYNPSQAKSLVQQAFPNGAPTITLDYPSGDPNNAIASAIAGDLKAVGITLQLNAQSASDYLTSLINDSQEMFLQVWVADYPLADWFLTPLFGAGSADNLSGYKDGSVQATLSQARATTNAAQRLSMYASVERSVLSDMAVSPIAFFRNHYAAATRVQGFYVDALGGFEIDRLSLGS
ncbi:MAG: ABC transporter substrate-binding protein [Candidatus Dormibacteria bacterium]